MAPKYKIHYFDVTSIGEPIRFLLSYGDLDWEDIRHIHAKWDIEKTSFPFEQMPVLYIDEKFYSQSTAISRYLAKQVGLAGKNDLENMEIDMIVELYRDFCQKISGWRYDPVPESKDRKEAPLFEEQIPFYLNKFEKMVQENDGYLVSGRLTWADIFFVAPLKYFKFTAGKDFLLGYAGLQGLVKKVESIPNIAAYIAKRPESNE